jgi:hypothetical protein
MRIRPAAAAGALAAALLVGLAGPASAHEEITPKTFPTGQPTFFTLTAANEHDDPLTGIVLHAPAGLSLGDTTRAPAGWSVTKTAGTLTWKGGSVKPDVFETWGFETDGVDQPGPLPFKVDLMFTHSNGDVETEGGIEVDVAATAGGTGGGAAGATTTTLAATTTTGPAERAAGRSDDSSGTATAALVLSIVALLAAIGALVLAGRRRTGRPPAGPGGTPATGPAQDW